MSTDRAYMANYMRRRYHERRQKAIRELGGRCACGATEQLDFHHRDASTKSFTMGSAFAGFSEERLATELTKCELTCKPCHRARHASKAVCGSVYRYDRGCRCELCKTARRDYERTRKAINAARHAARVQVAIDNHGLPRSRKR